VTRNFPDWISAYLNYTHGTEAPRIMHFWSAVSCLAACLRRKVWIDMKRFKWYPNFYIIFVAPPGIISKTTTMDMGMDLVKQVPGIKFGPDVVTWQALVTAFAASQEDFQFDEDWVPMSPITLASGELGNLINPQDRDMVNLFITLWDGRSSFEKITKGSGTDIISAPWINMIACTTPHWIADNMPSATVGGGFTSRCVFVYGDRKEVFIAYPDEHTRADHEEIARKLVADLEHISTQLVGEIKISEEARVWGREWYEKMWTTQNQRIDDDRLDGYLARKQTHMHKLAAVLSVSRGSSMEISLADLKLADRMLEATETDLDKVFSRIGRSEESLQAERFISFIKRYGKLPYIKAYQHIHSYFPDFRDFEGVLAGAIKSGQVRMAYEGNSTQPEAAVLIYTGG
jgi:hypothetical protein